MFQLLQSLNPVAFALFGITVCLGFVAAIAFTVSYVTRFRKPSRYRLSRVNGNTFQDLAFGDNFDEMTRLANQNFQTLGPNAYAIYDVTDFGNGNDDHHTVVLEKPTQTTE